MTKKRPVQVSPFKQLPECPTIDAAFRGIRISAASRTKKSAGLMVYGTVQVPEKDFETGAGVLDAVALVVTRPPPEGPFRGGGGYYRAWMPFRERVVLADDVQRSGGCVRGHFAVALPNDLPTFAGIGFYLLASVGPYTSDVLTIQVD